MLADVGVYSTQTYYIKRVIGLPGDHVVCCVNGKVTVNGVPLDETSYLFPGASPSVKLFNVIVPAGRLWVMGDNRAISDDSRGHMSAAFSGHGNCARERGAPAGRSWSSGRPRRSVTCQYPLPSSRPRCTPGPAGAPVLQVTRAAAAAVTAFPAAGAAASLLRVPMLALRTRRVLRTTAGYGGAGLGRADGVNRVIAQVLVLAAGSVSGWR